MLVLGCIGAKFEILQFFLKNALESSRRDLHNALLCTVLKAHILLKIAENFAVFKNKSLQNLPQFKLNFVEFY